MEIGGESRRGCIGGGCPKAAAQPIENISFMLALNRPLTACDILS
eukprot:COSAG01_NODE_1174_length_11380_cov_2.922205_4_plen_45_part_00